MLKKIYNFILSFFIENLKYSGAVSNFNTVIFSKDRPLQLDLLISSLDKLTDLTECYVIISVSSEEIRDMYLKIPKRHSLKVNFVFEEKNFKYTLRRLLSMIECKHVFLLVDDQACVRSIKIKEVYKDWCKKCVLTLRIGKSTDYSFNLNKDLNFNGQLKVSGSFIYWNTAKVTGDLCYMNSFDSTFILLGKLRSYAKYGLYSGPNSLESIMNYYYVVFKGRKNFIWATKSQKFVNLVANQVQSETDNRNPNIDNEILLKKFASGEYLDINRVLAYREKITSPHVPFNQVYD